MCRTFKTFERIFNLSESKLKTADVVKNFRGNVSLDLFTQDVGRRLVCLQTSLE